MTTESKILHSAKETFLKYGFHGTKLKQIAETAEVNKTVIHYYFRTKEKLYKEILSEIIIRINSIDLTNVIFQDEILKVKWFIYTEMYNNKNLFENTLKELYPSQWGEKLNLFIVLLEIDKIF